jgi:CRP-like cAMP-binding protein
MRQAFSAYSWIRSKALPEFAKAIMDNGNIVTYKRNEVITKPGKIYDSISILCRGLISKAILNNTVNKYKANSLLIPGRVLGTSFFMSREPSNLMVKAIRDSVLVSVSFKFIEDKIANDKNFMAVALKQFSMDWESDLEGLAALSFYTPEQKLKILFKGLILSYEINMNTEWLKCP